MKGRYKAYSEYKESGVEWLPDLPVNWSIERTKRMFSLKRSLVGNKSSNYQLLSLTLKGVIPRDISSGEGKIPESFDTYQRVDKDDLIFCLFDIDETPRTIGKSPQDGMITGAYNVYGCLDNCYSAYAYYYFFHIDSFKGLKPFYTGLRKVVRAETFGNVEMPCPSYIEQQKIANFLDHETAKIDTLITKQEKLIELLKEKRQVVISHAVTKGLNPDAPMKDSGVKWLGEVPEHWVVSKLGLYAHKIGSGKTPKGGADVYQESGVLFLRSQNVYDDGLRISGKEATYVSDEIHLEMQNTAVKPNDVLLNITGGSIGRTCIVPLNIGEANVNQHVCILRFPARFSSYFANVMKSSSIKEQIDVVQVGGNREGLNFEQIANMKVCIPSKDEMNQINKFIQSQLCKFDALVQKANKAITLIKERKTALISAAVTGKIDVSDWKGDY